MIERTLSMAFKNSAGKKSTLSIKDIKEQVLDADVASLMDLIISNNLNSYCIIKRTIFLNWLIVLFYFLSSI